jgi:CHRD domain
MLHGDRGVRRLGRIGICCACLSSVLVLNGSPAATAGEVSSMLQDQGGNFIVNLTGRDVPGGGDPDGQGSGRLELNAQRQTACANVSWKGLAGEVTALHLHVASAGNEGPHWVDFFNGKRFPGADGKFSDCVPLAEDKIRAVIDNPTGYYLNVHSTAFPNGALRGQLS